MPTISAVSEIGQHRQLDQGGSSGAGRVWRGHRREHLLLARMVLSSVAPGRSSLLPWGGLAGASAHVAGSAEGLRCASDE